jgi:hypothetical protein
MGGKGNVAVPILWEQFLHGSATEAGSTKHQQKETIIASMVGGVIGRRVMLHTLLGPGDFVQPCSQPGFGFPQHRENNEVQFQISFLSHRFHSELQYITIVSEGSMCIVGGRRVDLWMELSLERICVSLTCAPMQRAAGGGPLTLNFNSSPLYLTEAAFSFDIDQEGANHGVPCSGCGFLAITSPHASLSGE